MKLIRLPIALICCCAFFNSSAKTPEIFVAPKPNWVTSVTLSDYRPSLRVVSKGYFLSQLEEQINLEEQASYVRIIREIVNESGIQNGSEISISFDPVYETVKFHSIVVWRGNKPIDKLQLSSFKIVADEKDLSRFIYNGTYNAFIILKDIRKGDRIEFSYTRTGRNPIFGTKYSTILYMQDYKPVSHNYVSLIASSKRNLNFKYFNGAPKALTRTSNGYVKYIWEIFKQKPLDFEDDTPGWFDVCPAIQITEYKSWNEVSSWANSVNPANPNLSGELAEFTSELKKTYKDDRQRLFRAAVQFVQDQVRYMGIELGQYSHKANTPEKVFLQRYGDCKDKSLLLVSILRTLGFDAKMALLNTASREHLVDFLPAPNLFDHAVVAINIDNKNIWVDATYPYQGGKGWDIYFPQYRSGLVISTETNDLVAIPKSPIGKVDTHEHFEVEDKDSQVELTVKTTYTLNEADNMRNSLAAESRTQNEATYLKYYAETYPKIKAKDTIGVFDNRERNELVITEKYLIPEFFKKDSVKGTYKSSFYSNYISEVLPKISGERKQPLHLPYPKSVGHTITVSMPGGWNIDTETNELKSEDYRFHSYYTAIGDTLSLRYELEFYNDFVPPARSAAFAVDIKELKNNALEYVIVHQADKISFYPNFGMISFAIILLIVFCVSAYFLYQSNATESIYHKTPIRIGGWLILIILSLCGTVYNSLHDIIADKYLDINTWEFHSARETSSFYKVLLITEVFTTLYCLTFAIFCLFLIYNRLEFLPKIISVYFATYAIFKTLNYILYTALYGENSTSFEDVLYTVVVSFVCIYYFRSSERVKETFVVKLRSKSDGAGENF